MGLFRKLALLMPTLAVWGYLGSFSAKDDFNRMATRSFEHASEDFLQDWKNKPDAEFFYRTGAAHADSPPVAQNGFSSGSPQEKEFLARHPDSVESAIRTAVRSALSESPGIQIARLPKKSRTELDKNPLFYYFHRAESGPSRASMKSSDLDSSSIGSSGPPPSGGRVPSSTSSEQIEKFWVAQHWWMFLVLGLVLLGGIFGGIVACCSCCAEA